MQHNLVLTYMTSFDQISQIKALNKMYYIFYFRYWFWYWDGWQDGSQSDIFKQSEAHTL